jgi:hypothetical protein
MRKALIPCVAVACLTSACTLFEKTPTEKAVNVERLQCEPSGSPQADVQLIQSLRIVSVEPKVSPNMSAGTNKVVGTKLMLRVPDGFTPDKLTRLLQCHGARALLNHVDRTALPHDPYYLPDAWVSIDVNVVEGNYVATLTTDTVPDNLRIFHQATDYAAVERASAPPSAP